MFEGSLPLRTESDNYEAMLPEHIGFSEDMSSLNLGKCFKPGTDLSDWASVEPYYLELKNREISSKEELEKFLVDWSEIEAALSEYGTKLKVALSQNTGNQIAEAQQDRFIEQIESNSPEYSIALYKKFLDCKFRDELDQSYYRVLIKTAETCIRLHTPENVELEIEEYELVSEYEKVSSNLSCEIEGQSKTIPEVYPILFSPDRAKREEAWRKTNSSWLEHKEEFERIFSELVKIREQIRTNARFSSFTEYAFLSSERHDYSERDCQAFQDIIEKHVVPLARDLYKQRAERLRVSELKPWDTEATGLTADVLKPFSSIEALCDKLNNVLSKIDPGLSEQFCEMRRRGELDLEPRIGKTHCPYTEEFQASRRPFVFGNFTSTQDDIDTFAHECGHAFHYLALVSHDILEYRNAPLEFAEVASTTMEFLCAEHLDSFYDDPKDLNAARREFLEAKLLAFPVIAQIDAFQHWVYSNPNHSPKDLQAAWSALEDRFGFGVNWEGFEETKGVNFHRRGHIFTDPFYYIEYGLSELGAIEIWLEYKKDPVKAVEKFKEGLALGGSRSVPELYKAAGATFDFSESRIIRLVNALKSEIDGIKVPE